ncbi:hypothetical protein Nepgr_003096 [Nepenthes gracilis]|uniref:Pentatricopeptide repeat-containing protein n=1 Tax=Nepenthes gracilis TaxID=150966 RepID=A0AAD3XCY4_NEPGR|nr:hypothetical protein Nepgr_003096 [Nepenthes gracilis]
MFIPFQLLIPELSKSHQTISKTKQLHALITKTHLSLDPFYATKIVRFYALNDDLSSACNLFDEMPNRSVFLWNSIIRAYARARDFPKAFGLLKEMVRSETKPDSFTFACVLRACSENNDVDGLRSVHGGLVAFGLGIESICSSALVCAYSKLGLVGVASKVFKRVADPDLAMWNSMISGYGYCGFWDDGLKLFNAMRIVGEKPDGYTMVGLLSGLADPGLLGIAKGIHGSCLKNSFDFNVHVSSSLVCMYSRCNCLISAHEVFRGLLNPDLVTWTALITGFSQSGDNKNSLAFYREMNMKDVKADPVLIASALTASAQLSIVGPGCELHGYVLRHGLETDIMVSSSLIDMYSKCGFIDLAMLSFKILPHEDIVVYNAVISGLGSHGLASEAFRIFNEVLEKGLRPDESTFSALLHACWHAGLVNEGKQIFSRMKDEFDIEPETEHYVHMVKLLGMAGKLKEAYDLVTTLSEPVDAGIWGALLACCETHGDSRLAENVVHHISENKPEKSSYWVMLCNIYAKEGRWDEVKKLRDGMTNSGQRKTPGLSWITGSNSSVTSLMTAEMP